MSNKEGAYLSLLEDFGKSNNEDLQKHVQLENFDPRAK